ncbi:MAG: hypothetical protein ABFR82_09330 [Nitrospirota bacterium]
MFIPEKVSKKRFLSSFFVLCLSVFILTIAVPAQADELWEWSWGSMGTQTGDYSTPTNGWVTLTVTNNTDFAWGDMRFEIWSCPWMGCGDITNVGFLEGTHDEMETPVTDRSPFTYNIDNISVGATLDYFYYDNPIYSGGDTGMFKFKIDNPDGVLYTLAVIPSIVPEPVSSTLFIVGGATLGFRRFRKNFKK